MLHQASDRFDYLKTVLVYEGVTEQHHIIGRDILIISTFMIADKIHDKHDN